MHCEFLDYGYESSPAPSIDVSFDISSDDSQQDPSYSPTRDYYSDNSRDECGESIINQLEIVQVMFLNMDLIMEDFFKTISVMNMKQDLPQMIFSLLPQLTFLAENISSTEIYIEQHFLYKPVARKLKVNYTFVSSRFCILGNLF